MDGSRLPSEMRYVLLDKDIADLIDDMDNEDLKFLLEIIRENKDCDCGCRGRNHIDELAQTIVSTHLQRTAFITRHAQVTRLNRRDRWQTSAP